MAIRHAVIVAVLVCAAASCADEDPAPAARPESAASSSSTSTVTRAWGMTGTVKSFDSKAGTGIITADDGSGDLAVHYGDILVDGFKVLREGQRVSFIPVQGPRGPQATSVQDLEGR